jgi:hypothetical protein
MTVTRAGVMRWHSDLRYPSSPRCNGSGQKPKEET